MGADVTIVLWREVELPWIPALGQNNETGSWEMGCGSLHFHVHSEEGVRGGSGTPLGFCQHPVCPG